MKDNKIKVAYVLAYKDNSYVRTRVLLSALGVNKRISLYTAINSLKSPLLYVEVPLKLLWLRITKRPDKYILGFRGYEVYWPVRIITIGKELVFDEFVVFTDWIFNEHKKIRKDSFAGWIISTNYQFMLRTADKILSDTKAHSKLSANLNNIDKNKYTPVYVGTDESVFKPKNESKSSKFSIFFYGKMHPLHGLKYIVESMRYLPENIQLNIVGGDESTKKLIYDIKSKYNIEAEINYKSWIDFDDLPKEIAKSHICLGGPFGGTGQAKHVITGKTFQFLAMGKTTVIGEIQGEPELIHKKNCLIVKQASAVDLASSIKWCIDNPDKLLAIERSARETYESKFSEKIVAKTLDSIL